MVANLVDRRLGRDRVQLHHADRLAPRFVVSAADVHLGDVHMIPAERIADEPDQAGDVAVGEQKQIAVEMGVEPVGAKADEPEKLLAEEGAGGHIRFLVGRDLGLDQRAEVAGVGRLLLDDGDPALPGHDLGVHQVDLALHRRFHPAGREARRDEPRVLVGHLAAIAQRDAANGPSIHLRVENPQTPAQVEIEPEVFQFRAVERPHVHGKANLAGLEVVDQQLRRLDGDGNLRLLGGGPQVRRHENPRVFDQGVVGGGRLGVEHVDRRAGNLSRVQGDEQRVLVDQAAARAINDSHAGLHPRQGGRTNDVASLRRERSVNRDVVAAPPQVVERQACDAQLGRAFGREEGVETDHVHVEPLSPLRDRQADPTEPDDAQRLAAELRAGERVALPLPGLQAVIRLGDVPRQREHQRHRMLGRGDRVAAGGVHHHDPLASRGGYVDVIDPDPGPDDHLEPRLVKQDLGGELRPRSDHDAVGLRQGGAEAGGVELGGDDQFQASLGSQQFQALVGQLVRHQYAMRHGRCPFGGGED